MRQWERIRLALKGEVNIQIVCVRSPGDGLDECEALRWESVHFVTAPNQPLSDKFNVGVRYARGDWTDALVFAGSDDFLSVEYIREGVRFMRQGYQIAHTNGLFFYDTRQRQGFFTKATVGACSFVSAETLARCDYELFPSGRQKGVDQAFASRMRQQGAERIAVIGQRGDRGRVALLDVKSYEAVALEGTGTRVESTNVNSYGRMQAAFGRKAVSVNMRELADRCFCSGMLQDLLSLEPVAGMARRVA